MCKRSPLWVPLLLAFLLASLFLVEARGQDTSEVPPTPMLDTSSSSTTPESEPPSPTDWRASIVSLWTAYDAEFQSSILSLETFLDQVEAYGIKFEDLPSYIGFLESSYSASETARKAEALIAAADLAKEKARADQAENERLAWQIGAGAAAGVGLVGWIFYLVSRAK